MSESTVAIIDGGGANIASLRFALERLGHASELTQDHDRIRRASHVILPGVGAARSAMDKLRSAGLDRLIPGLSQPVLGICLGMQLLCEGSEEDDTPCLGIVAGRATRFESVPERPVPHMGWNQLRLIGETPLLAGIQSGAYCYFVHSYAIPVGPATRAACDYGSDFTAVLSQGNFHGAQFHPERSGAIGARLLENFLTRF